MDKQNGANQIRAARLITVISLNIIIIFCVVSSIITAFNNAADMSFNQNIENVATLTDASADKVKLAINHYSEELTMVANYINNFGSNGMTKTQISDFLKSLCGTEDCAEWHLVNNYISDASLGTRHYKAILPAQDSAASYNYKLSAYNNNLSMLFRSASAETVGKITYTYEFSEPVSGTEVFAVATTVKYVPDAENATDKDKGDSSPYCTLMRLVASDSINGILENNNGTDSFEYFGYSNVLVDKSGNYIVSTAYFQETNFFDYISLYNKDFSQSQLEKLLADMSENKEVDALYYQNCKMEQCVFMAKPIQGTDWYLLSMVPLASFHITYDFNLDFLTFMFFFGVLFVFDISMILSVNKKLSIKTKEAKFANESKSVFLSSMSHDIRTPMNAIMGMAIIANKQLEEQNPDKDTLKECMRSIELSGNHLLTLINDVLDISKIESGKIVLYESDFSIAETVSKVVEICQTNIKAKGFTFEAHVKEVEHEYVTGDSLRINQIFINILSNAIKYTESGGKIVVDLIEKPIENCNEKARYVFIVQDTGIGMTPEFVKTIFNRFTRAVDTRINSVQGTGLGMAIVKQLVDMMGGNIQIESQINVGTNITITLDLPIVDNKLVTENCVGLPMLLIDDDDIVLESVKGLLRGFGAVVDSCNNGKLGIETVKQKLISDSAYRIVFVDWKMESMSGKEVIKQLREIAGNKLAIVVMTAYNVSEIGAEARKAGADYFVTKPLFKSKLISTINYALAGNKDRKREELERFEGLRLLVAEDNEINWKVLNKLLKMYDITAERAENGLVAVEAVQNNEAYDLILMDIRMPVLNGYEAAEKIRAMEDKKKNSIPIYAMTADTFADDVRKAQQAGMNGHLAKPIDLKKVIEVIRTVYDSGN